MVEEVFGRMENVLVLGLSPSTGCSVVDVKVHGEACVVVMGEHSLAWVWVGSGGDEPSDLWGLLGLGKVWRGLDLELHLDINSHSCSLIRA